jgi:hypothetical protein
MHTHDEIRISIRRNALVPFSTKSEPAELDFEKYTHTERGRDKISFLKARDTWPSEYFWRT